MELARGMPITEFCRQKNACRSPCGWTLKAEREVHREQTTQAETQRSLIQHQSPIALIHTAYVEYFLGRSDVARQKLQSYDVLTGEMDPIHVLPGVTSTDSARFSHERFQRVVVRSSTSRFHPTAACWFHVSGMNACRWISGMWRPATSYDRFRISKMTLRGACFSTDGSMLLTAEEGVPNSSLGRAIRDGTIPTGGI